FYQMVVHGSIPYSSDPGNLSYDLRYHVLKWVEYGCMPYFELTFQKSINLKNTEYSRLFTSYYSQWNDVIADVYNELNSRLKDVWSESITLHEKLDKDLYKVEYSNGAIVYINYGMQQAQADGFIVKPQDFLVVNKGGVTR
ncbi:MAG: hypothetical protein GX754_07600, partial [Clostridiaceae bacterium]|nr:hypothetical protein [Clostridiaceae bacterium]